MGRECGKNDVFRIPPRLTWREEGGEVVEDLGVPLAAREAHHGAHVQGEGPQLLSRAEQVHLQHIFHIVQEAHKQEAVVRAGGEH